VGSTVNVPVTAPRVEPGPVDSAQVATGLAATGGEPVMTAQEVVVPLKPEP
jgi:hypothetical protein